MFAVASYNILADAYTKPDRYPRTPAELLEPGGRLFAIADTIAALDADIVCLQEVERAAFEQLTAQLGAIGYTGAYLPKTGGRPDGCATFVRRPAAIVDTHEHAYRDGRRGQRDSGHVALITMVELDGRSIAVANTHLRWSAPETDIADQWAHRQITELTDVLDDVAPASEARIVCGDFNAEPDSAVAAAIEAAGYAAALGSVEAAYTCNAHGRARKLDFVFHTAALVASPRTPPPLADDTTMPSHTHASDHLPICAEFRW